MDKYFASCKNNILKYFSCIGIVLKVTPQEDFKNNVDIVIYRNNVSENSRAEPLPIIELTHPRDKSIPKKYVMLNLPYGLVIDNGDKNRKPYYRLFMRDQKRIIKTTDPNEFISEIENIPDMSQIDIVGKCTVPFYTQYGINIDKEYSTIMKVLRRKRFRLLRDFAGAEKHAKFCCCEYLFRILDKPPDQQVNVESN